MWSAASPDLASRRHADDPTGSVRSHHAAAGGSTHSAPRASPQRKPPLLPPPAPAHQHGAWPTTAPFVQDDMLPSVLMSAPPTLTPPSASRAQPATGARPPPTTDVARLLPRCPSRPWPPPHARRRPSSGPASRSAARLLVLPGPLELRHAARLPHLHRRVLPRPGPASCAPTFPRRRPGSRAWCSACVRTAGARRPARARASSSTPDATPAGYSGRLVLLADQDRPRWHHDEIAEAPGRWPADLAGR